MGKKPNHKNICKAQTLKHRGCKNNSIRGSRYCRFHSLSLYRWKGIPLKFNLAKIFVPLLTVVISPLGINLLTDWIDEGATVEQARSIKSDTVEIKTDSKKIINYEEEIMKRLERLDRRSGPDFRKKYPLGYTLITATERNEVYPLESPVPSKFRIDWNKQSPITVTPEAINIKFPLLVVGGYRFHDLDMAFLRSSFTNGTNMLSAIATDDFGLRVEIVEDFKTNVTLVLGYSSK